MSSDNPALKFWVESPFAGFDQKYHIRQPDAGQEEDHEIGPESARRRICQYAGPLFGGLISYRIFIFVCFIFFCFDFPLPVFQANNGSKPLVSTPPSKLLCGTENKFVFVSRNVGLISCHPPKSNRRYFHVEFRKLNFLENKRRRGSWRSGTNCRSSLPEPTMQGWHYFTFRPLQQCKSADEILL